jgi:hypothetical protein
MFLSLKPRTQMLTKFQPSHVHTRHHRFVCCHCANVNFCHNCEASNLEHEFHDAKHLWLQIMRPLPAELRCATMVTFSKSVSLGTISRKFSCLPVHVVTFRNPLYLMMHLSDSDDQNRTLVLQTVLVIHVLPSLVPHALGCPHIVMASNVP